MTEKRRIRLISHAGAALSTFYAAVGLLFYYAYLTERVDSVFTISVRMAFTSPIGLVPIIIALFISLKRKPGYYCPWMYIFIMIIGVEVTGFFTFAQFWLFDTGTYEDIMY